DYKNLLHRGHSTANPTLQTVVAAPPDSPQKGGGDGRYSALEGHVDTNPVDTRPIAGDPRVTPQRTTADVVLALVDQSRLRRECLKLAMAQHNARWRVVDLANAQEVVRLAEAGQRFDLVLIGAATSEHVDLEEIETLRATLPDTPIVVSAESENPHRAR